MITFDREKINNLIDDDNLKEIINYVSEEINVHNERLKIITIDEFETNKLTIDKKRQFVIILNNSNKETITINGTTFEEVLCIDNTDTLIIESKLDDTKTIKFLVFEDTCKNFKHNENLINKFKRDVCNNIFVIEDNNILNHDDCDFYKEIISNFIDNNNYCNKIWEPGNNVNCNTFVISQNKLNDFFNKSLVNEIMNKTTRIFNNIRAYLKQNYELDIKGDSGFQFRKIFGPTRIHKDGVYDASNPVTLHVTRIASVVICLNDDYEGGEFCFPIQDIKVKLKKGQIIVFPPYWTHPHYTMELKNRTYRYTINSWLFENAENFVLKN